MAEFAKAVLLGVKVRTSCQHPPYLHIYICKKPPEQISDYQDNQ